MPLAIPLVVTGESIAVPLFQRAWPDLRHTHKAPPTFLGASCKVGTAALLAGPQ
ncbi:hypothetical protein AB4Y89_08205 [Terriglobus sp. 2YAB30_2]|uniref:hypothetical protein n=1 Tax=unclassified Terriglobus TaxID=2628988 RepID=UPI003F9688B1